MPQSTIRISDHQELDIISVDQSFEMYSERQKELVALAFKHCPWASHSFIFGYFLPNGAYPIQKHWDLTSEIDGDRCVWRDDTGHEITILE